MNRVEVIGNATLHLGDCREILPTLGPVDAVIVDPPYGINTRSDGSGKLSPWGDLCNAAFWYADWLSTCRKLIGDSGALWSFLNWRSMVTFQKASCDIRWPIESLLIWDKDWIGPGGPKGLRPSYEMVALFAGVDFTVENRSLRDIQRFPWSAHKPNGHPAEKPQELFAWLIKHTAPAGGIVCDPFMGSGTCGAACVATGRSFLGIELDEAWFDIACRRIEQAQRQADLFIRPSDPERGYQQAALSLHDVVGRGP